jgi:hypothetical protein
VTTPQGRLRPLWPYNWFAPTGTTSRRLAVRSDCDPNAALTAIRTMSPSHPFRQNPARFPGDQVSSGSGPGGCVRIFVFRITPPHQDRGWFARMAGRVGVADWDKRCASAHRHTPPAVLRRRRTRLALPLFGLGSRGSGGQARPDQAQPPQGRHWAAGARTLSFSFWIQNLNRSQPHILMSADVSSLRAPGGAASRDGHEDAHPMVKRTPPIR